MANKKPEEIVQETEEVLAAGGACPNCGMFFSHAANCEYLLHKGNVDAANKSKSEDKDETKDKPAEVKEVEESTDDGGNKELLDLMKGTKKK